MGNDTYLVPSINGALLATILLSTPGTCPRQALMWLTLISYVFDTYGERQKQSTSKRQYKVKK